VIGTNDIVVLAVVIVGPIKNIDTQNTRRSSRFDVMVLFVGGRGTAEREREGEQFYQYSIQNIKN